MHIHTHLEGHVDVPLEQVWGFSRDLHTLPMWHVMVVGVKDVVGTFDTAGSSATLTLKALDGLHDVHMEITEAEPLRLVSQVGRQLDGPMRYTSTFRYTPAGRGFDWTWDQDNEIPDGIPGPFGSEAFMSRFFDLALRHSTETHTLLIEALVPQPV